MTGIIIAISNIIEKNVNSKRYILFILLNLMMGNHGLREKEFRGFLTTEMTGSGQKRVDESSIKGILRLKEQNTKRGFIL